MTFVPGLNKEGYRVIVCCLADSDVGRIAERAARKLAAIEISPCISLRKNQGVLSYDELEMLRTARQILVIDGCDQECAVCALQEAGIRNAVHLCLSDIGLMRGHSTITPYTIDMVVREGRRLIRQDDSLHRKHA
jgi:uncharacterized metal-binding protein